MQWHLATKSDEAFVDESTQPFHAFIKHAAWVLGSGQGLAIVAPVSLRWADAGARGARIPGVKGQLMCLTSLYVKPQLRGRGYARDAIRVLRERYGESLLIN